MTSESGVELAGLERWSRAREDRAEGGTEGDGGASIKSPDEDGPPLASAEGGAVSKKSGGAAVVGRSPGRERVGKTRVGKLGVILPSARGVPGLDVGVMIPPSGT